MAVNIPGAVAVVVFYIAILVLGIVAGRKSPKAKSNDALLVADRSLGMLVSVFTLTATVVGGGYILGTAEYIAWHGVVQTQAPVGYCISMLIAAAFYAPKIRKEKYSTMFDPFQLKYGKKMGALLFIPQLLGDLFWSAAVLAALGATVSIILNIDAKLAIVLSAAVAIFYTFLGGLFAVAYTDVLQLIFIAIGLIIAFPFALTNPAVNIDYISEHWRGTVPVKTIGSYIDIYMLCLFGGLPWQALYQRVLACKTDRISTVSIVISSFLVLALAIPPAAMGLAGAAADWNQTSYDGKIPFPTDMRSYILPLTLNYLTPLPVGIIGIGAITAAAMSSSDSCILSTSSVITKNIYQDIFKPEASEKEIVWVLRVTIVIVGTMGTLIAMFSTTIYALYVLCADLMYVVLFPQLTLVLWMTASNAYGSLAGFIVAFAIRLLSGEPVLGVPALIKFPYYDEENDMQLFPFRTFAMLLGTVIIIVVSLMTNAMFVKGRVPRKYDFMECYKKRTHHIRPKVDVRVCDPDNELYLLETKEPDDVGTKNV